jgi:hypothetical protein
MMKTLLRKSLLLSQAMKENFTWMKWGKRLVVHEMVMDMVMEVVVALVESNKLTSRNNCCDFNPGYWIVPYSQWDEDNARTA